MKRITISLDTKCGVCDRKVGVVQDFLPFKDGIRHAFCVPDCRGCGGGFGHPDDITEDENGDWFCRRCSTDLRGAVEW